MSRVLIFVAHSGGGHMSLAEALRDRLPAGSTATLVDPMPRAASTHYRLISRHALWVWAIEFYSTNTPARARVLHYALTFLLQRRLQHLFDTYQPDIVLSTSSMVTEAALRRLAHRQAVTPFAVLIADAQNIHATWLTARDATATLAPTRESYQEAVAAGFTPRRLYLTGWPVRAQFERMYNRAEVHAQLQLDPTRFTVFVQGGGEGTAHFVRTVESVLNAGLAQVILAAGTNQALIERFRGVPNVRALAFTPEIAPFMAASDVVLGKAGPNMLFETVMLGKPFIATTYIPGQETGNLAMIERYQLGWVALDTFTQYGILHALVHNPSQLAATTAAVERYRNWNRAANESLNPLLRELCATSIPVNEPTRLSQHATTAEHLAAGGSNRN